MLSPVPAVNKDNPTFPLFSRTNSSPSALAETVPADAVNTFNLPSGVVVPIPTFLLVSTASAAPPFCIKLNPTLVNVPTEDAPPVLPKYI